MDSTNEIPPIDITEIKKETNQASPKLKRLNAKTLIVLSWSILVFIILLLVFKAGMMIGFKKANFSLQWGQNYHQNFSGPRGNFFMSTFGPDEYIESNGAFGQILKINDNSLIMNGVGNLEKIILINNDTIIRNQRDNLKANELKIGDNIVVIGEPDNEGQIKATLIRIMPTPPPNQMPMMNFFQERLF